MANIEIVDTSSRFDHKNSDRAKQIKSNQYKNSRGLARYDVTLSIE
ncbi:hypothetical protein [Lactococcus cremoris]|nr:hypothetical protein [Lactococcus cremoris]